ncbi:hypothetical protein [uncultured Bacteroides sp.]|uniref:hypothetical protein n=1 Tax=uncultured Bacteroides sp. TaxID=162156 RepID=UPI002597E0DD|nr:hypothetical protein [uncultured Bacteroides sp.]
MRVDGVTFVVAEVKKVTKEKFIENHIGVLWQSIKESDRKKKLSDVYDSIVGKPKQEVAAAETSK